MRAAELWRNRCRYPSAAHAEEISKLEVHISERAKIFSGCPEGYDAIQALKDFHRLEALNAKRLSSRGILSDAEDAEEVYLTALSAAYNRSPESRAREQIAELALKALMREHELLLLARSPLPQSPSFEVLTPEEQNELDPLRARYPELPMDPDHPLAEMMKYHQEKMQQEEDRRRLRRRRWSDKIANCDP